MQTHRITATTLLLLILLQCLDTLTPNPATAGGPLPMACHHLLTPPRHPSHPRVVLHSLSASNAPPNANTNTSLNTNADVNNAPSDDPQKVGHIDSFLHALFLAPSKTSHATSVGPATPARSSPSRPQARRGGLQAVPPSLDRSNARR